MLAHPYLRIAKTGFTMPLSFIMTFSAHQTVVFIYFSLSILLSASDWRASGPNLVHYAEVFPDAVSVSLI